MNKHFQMSTLRTALILLWSAALLSILGFWYEWDDDSRPDPGVLAKGKTVYHTACSPCHGKNGKGDGIIAANLTDEPRDLTSGVYQNRSTMSGQLPTKYDLYTTLSNGIHTTPMPHFRGLSPEDRSAVVEYIRTLSARFSDPEEYPLTVLPESEAPLLGPEAMVQGRKIYVAMKCADCHGATGKGDGEIMKKPVDEKGNLIETPDLTDPASYEYSHSPKDLYRIFSTGLDGTPMPSYFATINEADRWHLTYYVWSLRNGYTYIASADTARKN
jgi:mono/diheme cytochrome c family protein